MSKLRPPLRYHGGKWKLAPWLISLMPRHRVYVEPFGGGGSVLLRKERSYAEVYNDLDGQIVNLFRVIRDDADSLVRQLELTPFSREEFAASYEDSPEPVEQARRTVCRSHMGFGSAAASGAKTGFRANSNRSGTTPARDWRNLPANIPALTDRLRGVVIENREAVDVIAQHDGPETLHYCDPPYVFDTRSIGNPYCKKGYRHEMTDEQHRDLVTALRGVSGMVMLSGYHGTLYDELLADWRFVDCAAFADGARPRTETVWMNQAAWQRTPHNQLFGQAVNQ